MKCYPWPFFAISSVLDHIVLKMIVDLIPLLYFFDRRIRAS